MDQIGLCLSYEHEVRTRKIGLYMDLIPNWPDTLDEYSERVIKELNYQTESATNLYF